MIEANAAVVRREKFELEFPRIEKSHHPWNEEDGLTSPLLFIVEANFTDIDARHDVPLSSWRVISALAYSLADPGSGHEEILAAFLALSISP
jgi:hypothetical protein